MEAAQYRHEYKYPLTSGQILMEDAKIRAVACKDIHAGTDGFYHIRSLYFDDYDNSCFMDNENGVDNREKYRIRIYNHSAERIALEIKQKRMGKTLKHSCPISMEQCQKLMRGEIPLAVSEKQAVLRKLIYLMETRIMRPAVIVDYDRVPYVYRKQDANVRVTFDRNITSITEIHRFFDKTVTGRGILPIGQALMEVKYDSFLPDEIYSLLQLEGLTASTFSKYYLCRKFA